MAFGAQTSLRLGSEPGKLEGALGKLAGNTERKLRGEETLVRAGAGAALLATNLLPTPLAALRSDAIVHETETADTIMGEAQKDSAEGSTAAAGAKSPVTLKSIMAELAAFKSDMQKKDEAFKEEMKNKDEAFKEEMTKKEQEVQKKDEMIAELLAALKSKTDHKQVQTSAGGE